MTERPKKVRRVIEYEYHSPLYDLRTEAKLARSKLADLAFPEERERWLVALRIAEIERGQRLVRGDKLQNLSNALGQTLERTPSQILENLAPLISEDAESLLVRRHVVHFSKYIGGGPKFI